jgi:Spy/CpxP family protein refolding chaperone
LLSPITKQYKRRKKMKKALTIGGLLVLAVAIAVPVLAYGPGLDRGKGTGMMFSQRGFLYCEGLSNLTAEQSAKLGELREQRLKETAPLHSDLFNKQAELKVLWNQASPDAAAIQAKQKEINELRARLQERNTDYHLELQKLLTPEQKAQIQSQRWKKGYSQKSKKRGKGGHGGRGSW